MNTSGGGYLLAWIDPAYCLRLTQALVHVIWEGGVIAVVYAAAVFFLRGASANARYAVGVAALVLMAACLPLTLLVLPTAKSESGHELHPAAATSLLVDPHPAVLQEKTPVPTDVRPRVIPSPQRADSVSVPVPPDDQLLEQSAGGMSRWLASISPFATALYFCGVIVMLIRLSLGLWGGRRLRLASTPCRDEAILQLVADHASGLRLRITPHIAWCARLAVPVVVGVLRPVILLPTILATGLTSDQLRAVLLHELAHVRRYDLAVNVLQRLIEAFLFFHPAVWWISRRVSIERENACDDLVLALNYQRTQYAEALVRVAEVCATAGIMPNLASGQATALAATGSMDRNSSQFKRRILRLIDQDEQPRFLLSGSGLLFCLLALVALLLAPALVHTQEQPGADAAKQSKSGGAVEGVVIYGDSEKPAAKVRVVAEGKSNYAQTRTDEKGQYHFDKLPTDTYNVWAQSDGWTMKAITGLVLTSESRIKNDEMRLVKGGFAKVRVVDDSTGLPLSSIQIGQSYSPASVGIYGPARPYDGSREGADVNSRGEAEVRLPPGINHIYLFNMQPGWLVKGREFERPGIRIEEGKTAEVEFRLKLAPPAKAGPVPTVTTGSEPGKNKPLPPPVNSADVEYFERLIRNIEANNDYIQTAQGVVEMLSLDPSVDKPTTSTSPPPEKLTPGAGYLTITQAPLWVFRREFTIKGNNVLGVQLERVKNNWIKREVVSRHGDIWTELQFDDPPRALICRNEQARGFPYDPRELGGMYENTTLLDQMKRSRVVKVLSQDHRQLSFQTEMNGVGNDSRSKSQRIDYVIDMSKTYRPTMVIAYSDDGNGINVVSELSYQEVNPGKYWFLRELTQKYFLEKGITDPASDRWHQMLIYRVGGLRINEPINDDVFEVKIPSGTRVSDGTGMKMSSDSAPNAAEPGKNNTSGGHPASSTPTPAEPSPSGRVQPEGAGARAPFKFDTPDDQIVACVGSETITARDLKNSIRRVLLTHDMAQDPELYEKAGPETLSQLIDRKCIYAAAVSDLGPEKLAQVRARVDEYFDKDELPALLKSYGASDQEQLEKKLQEGSDSLANLRQSFFEEIVGSQWVKEKIETETAESPDTPATRKERAERYLAQLRERTKVWTIYDDKSAAGVAPEDQIQDFLAAIEFRKDMNGRYPAKALENLRSEITRYITENPKWNDAPTMKRSWPSYQRAVPFAAAAVPGLVGAGESVALVGKRNPRIA
jgi:beta-lactamase regulating signal transducer with metallopeptidase domain